jgi:hypothetical protein
MGFKDFPRSIRKQVLYSIPLANQIIAANKLFLQMTVIIFDKINMMQ